MQKKYESWRTFKVLSLLLSYPETGWVSEIPALLDCMHTEKHIGEKEQAVIHTFAMGLYQTELLEIQAAYVSLFDQNKQVSLYLFEHVHGESRDRGQAMVDLKKTYEQYGLLLDAKELPDYLPLFLECLSAIPADQALLLLQDCIHIIEQLAKILAERGVAYTAVFNALLSLGDRPPVVWELKAMVEEQPAFEMLDKSWEEEEIKFLGSTQATCHGCGTTVKSTQNGGVL